MYYPVQMPHILNKKYSHEVKYTEEFIPDYKDFIICIWDMQSFSNAKKTIEHIIITDGCIDLIADYEKKSIFITGLSKTVFHNSVNLPINIIGVRFKPGAFHELTNIPANKVMDNLIHINAIDKNFDINSFFTLKISDAKEYLKKYVGKLIQDKKPNKFMSLFDEINNNIPDSTSEIYDNLYYSHRQCQRLFLKNYGLSPQMVLCILRFQKCLKHLISGKTAPKDMLNITNFYDQSHFINDFKRNIGLTPQELIDKYIN